MQMVVLSRSFCQTMSAYARPRPATRALQVKNLSAATASRINIYLTAGVSNGTGLNTTLPSTLIVSMIFRL